MTVRTAVLASAAVLGLALPAARDAIESRQGPSSRPVRVLLAMPRDEASLEATGAWRLLAADRREISRGRLASDRWIVQRDGARLRVAGPGGAVSPWYQGTATLEAADPSALLVWGGRKYRGVLLFTPAETSLVVVNRLDVEDYLRGVVPLEVGTKAVDDHAAVEAQAVAARSYTYTRMLYGAPRDFDLTATSSDQVYRGVDVESFIGDLAVSATAGWVLSVDGRVVSAPYHSTCGGTTAAPSEVWRGTSDGFLRSVSDRIPGTERSWCDISPRFQWDRRIDAAALDASLARNGDTYVRVPPGGLGSVRSVRVDGTTASGRAAAVTITTDRGDVTLRGNDLRYVLREVGGEILGSTYVSLESERARDGSLTQLIVHGRGYGHGVGMCQWGAIGRARAGQDFSAILRAYYPGARLVRAP